MNFTPFSFSSLLFYALVFFFLIQLFYFFYFFFRLAFHRRPPAATERFEPVSVVIAARSEAHNLVAFLPHIFEQKYPEFEVVVVNDRSWDDSKEILKAFMLKYPNLHVVNIEEGNHKSPGKKMAVTLGIKGAKYERIVVTDADCKPMSRNWLSEINAAFNSRKGTEMVLGYSPFKKTNGFLNKLIRFDGLWVAIQYLSYAKAGVPYMGVGRNMAYNKELFFKVGGFKKHYHITSGDDDLFVNETARKSNTVICISSDSHVETLPKETWEHWVHQKKRHFTTAPMYRFSHRFLLFLWPFSLLLFYGLTIALLVLNKFILITLILLAFRTLLLIVTFTRAGKWLGQKDLVWMAWFFELVFLIIYPSFYLSGRKTKKDKWS